MGPIITDLKFDLPRDPLEDSPEVQDWLRSSGYKLSYDGTYKRITNIGGAQQIETMQPDQAKRLYQSQQYVLDAAQLPSGVPDYLSQIQGMLQSSNQQQGGASSWKYSNPYEKRLAALVNNPDSIENTNAYKFRFNQGQQALERSAAAKGMLNSGNTLAELARYGQGMASDEYGREFERLNSATGQRNQYNLGLMGAANQELGLKQQNISNSAGIALKALTSADEVYNERKRLSLMAATGGGLLKSGPSNQYATW